MKAVTPAIIKAIIEFQMILISFVKKLLVKKDLKTSKTKLKITLAIKQKALTILVI
jgi:hypothetical protein